MPAKETQYNAPPLFRATRERGASTLPGEMPRTAAAFFGVDGLWKREGRNTVPCRLGEGARNGMSSGAPETVCGVPVGGLGKKIMSSTPVRDYWGESGVPARAAFSMRPASNGMDRSVRRVWREGQRAPFCGLPAFVGRMAAFFLICRSIPAGLPFLPRFLAFHWSASQRPLCPGAPAPEKGASPRFGIPL